MGKLKTRVLVLCVTLLIVMMVIVPSVTARCSNTPQPAAWGYNYLGAMTIEDYGDVCNYFASGCAAGAVASAVCARCSILIHPGAVRACELICRVIRVLPAVAFCTVYAILNIDYTNKNSWLRNNCAPRDRRLVDWYVRAWWFPTPIPMYTNARCGCPN